MKPILHITFGCVLLAVVFLSVPIAIPQMPADAVGV